jgi:V/A-type H+-transporting ATPase subunit E
VGYGELLRVIEEEASREAREIREAAGRERDRILAEARGAADAARGAALERERLEEESRRKTAGEASGLEGDRALLVEQRRLLDALREEVAARLPRPVGREVLSMLLAETVIEAWEGRVEIVVDPGEEETVRSLLGNVAPDVLARAEIRAAPAARGGVEVICGRRVLDDTLASRLERAWPALEPELAQILFGEG